VLRSTVVRIVLFLGIAVTALLLAHLHARPDESAKLQAYLPVE